MADHLAGNLGIPENRTPERSTFLPYYRITVIEIAMVEQQLLATTSMNCMEDLREDS